MSSYLSWPSGCLPKSLFWLTSLIPSTGNGATLLGLGKDTASYSSVDMSLCIQLEGSAKRSSLIQIWMPAVAETRAGGCVPALVEGHPGLYLLRIGPTIHNPFSSSMFSNNHTAFQKEREYITQWANSQISLLVYESCDVTRKHTQREYPNPLLLLCFCLLFSWTEIWKHC